VIFITGTDDFSHWYRIPEENILNHDETNPGIQLALAAWDKLSRWSDAMTEAVLISNLPSTSEEKHEGMNLIKEVALRTPGDSRVEMCIQCGTCGGSCPSARAMDHTPRAIFAMLRANMKDEVMKSNTPWMCVSCYYCTVRCPQEIHITDVMYTLKNMALKENKYRDTTAPDFSKTFINFVQTYGRSFEIGLAGIHNLKHFATRLPNMAPMALGFLTKKGMSPVPPRRIKGMNQLKKILKRAKELEAA
jgi:heterodisulfide reductase subunit C